MLLILFDFDGTISTCDSTTLFFKYLIGDVKYSFKKYTLFFPYLVLYKLKVISDGYLKKIRNSIMLGQFEYDYILHKAYSFSNEVLPSTIKKSAEKKIVEYKHQDAIIVIVSASLDIVLSEWCKKNGLILITNSLKVISNKVNGEFELPDCNYEQKAIRIMSQFDLSQFNEIHAYGDTKGDIAMLNLATKKYFKFFQ